MMALNYNNRSVVTISPDGGTTWVERILHPTGTLNAMASNFDGSKLIILGSKGMVFRSTDFGNSWVGSTPLGVGISWTMIAASADCSRGAALGVIDNTTGNTLFIFSEF